MAEIQTTVTVDGVPIGLSVIPWNGTTADVEALTLRDPITGIGASVEAPGTAPTSVVGVNGPGQNTNGCGQFVPVADNCAVINVTAASTTQIVPAQSGKRIFICSFFIDSNGTGTIQWVQGGSNAALSGAMPVTPETGLSAGSGYGAVLIATSGNNVSITTTATATAQGACTYTYFT